MDRSGWKELSIITIDGYKKMGGLRYDTVLFERLSLPYAFFSHIFFRSFGRDDT